MRRGPASALLLALLTAGPTLTISSSAPHAVSAELFDPPPALPSNALPPKQLSWPGPAAKAVPCGKEGPTSANSTCPAGHYCNPDAPQPNLFSRCGTDEKTAWENCASTKQRCSTSADCHGANETCYDDVNCGAGVCSPLMKYRLRTICM